jgi:Fe-S-cluster-containing hydrogenase component 2
MTKMIVTNPDVCTGCRVCENVCSLVHFGECNPAKARIRVMRWETLGIDVPVTCLQCEEAPCAESCPTNAIQRNAKTGAMETDEDLCIQCHMCALVCPFGATLLGPEDEILRCDFCGGDPECVKLCEQAAIQYLPRVQLATMKMRQAVKDFFPDLLKEAKGSTKE